MMLSSDWEWTENEEVFVTSIFSFDVDKAKRLIRRMPRPVIKVPVADYAGLIEAIPITLDSRRVAKANLAVPVILVTMRNGGRLLIDGWHRVGAAVKLRTPGELWGVVLTREETKKVRC